MKNPKTSQLTVILAAALGGACFVQNARPVAGRAILYTSQPPGSTEDLRALDPAASSSQVLVRGDSLSSRSLAAWSPDSRGIALVREYGSHDELYVVDSTGRTERRLGPNLPKAIMFPDWSPSGRDIAVSSGDSAEKPGLYLVDVSSGEPSLLRRDAAAYRCPSWSPTGDRFVVAAYQTGRSALLVLDATGSVADTLAASDSTYLDCPQWSPKGSEVLFTVFHDGGKSGWERPAFHSNLALITLADRKVRQLTRDSGLTNYGRWARDGEWIVFQSDRHASPTRDPAQAGQMLRNLEIWIMRRDGTGFRRLTANSHFDAHPSW
jgi:Tol biopolymer transport system component